VEKGVEELKRAERHLENVAAKMKSKDTMTHFVNAGMDVIQAANAALKQLEIPDEAKARIHRAEREVLLAARNLIDAILSEVESEIPRREKAELKKVSVKRKSK
jgi:folate-dependent phosphoribosylglycinamide formyltransferase PurN